jgi:hypothetical protein
MSTDVAVKQSAEVEALIARQEEEFTSDTLTVPILKVGQALTKEVQSEQCEAGDFINTLTGESLGNKVEFIVAFYNRGRFAADPESSRAYVAFSDIIPEQWVDLVGEEFINTPFSEYPEAEEKFKEAVNNKERPWGKGPLVSTTHNYTGYAIASALAGTDDEDELVPVRLSLKRTDVPAAKKINTLKRISLRGKPFWDRAFELSTEKKTFDRGYAFNVNVALGRATSADERELAVELAQAVAGERVVSNEAAVADKPVKPSAKGGLGDSV